MKRLMFVVALIATPLGAKTSLRDVPEVRDGLVAFGAADIIRQECDKISPRWLRAVSHIKALEKRAQELGYSETEIKAYTRDRSEKTVLTAQAMDVLAGLGVNPAQSNTYCTAGLAEIKKGSVIGQLLRAD